jgi:hypothetical protein
MLITLSTPYHATSDHMAAADPSNSTSSHDSDNEEPDSAHNNANTSAGRRSGVAGGLEGRSRGAWQLGTVALEQALQADKALHSHLR